MGHGLAQVCAQAGCHVAVRELNQEKLDCILANQAKLLANQEQRIVANQDKILANQQKILGK